MVRFFFPLGDLSMTAYALLMHCLGVTDGLIIFNFDSGT